MPRPYTPNDKYFYKAKKQGFRARSVFKLDEIQERFKIIKPQNIVLDLGAAPGSFLQSIGKMIGEKGLAIGVDLKEIEPLKNKNIHTIQADIFDQDFLRQKLIDFKINKFDVITADLAPKTTGVKDVDQYRSVELNGAVLEIAQAFLKPGGHLITKIFTGEDFDAFLFKIKKYFQKVSCYKPHATRDRSKEVYLICRQLKG